MIKEIFLILVSIFLIIQSIISFKYLLKNIYLKKLLDDILYYLSNTEGNLPHDQLNINRVKKIILEELGDGNNKTD